MHGVPEDSGVRGLPHAVQATEHRGGSARFALVSCVDADQVLETLPWLVVNQGIEGPLKSYTYTDYIYQYNKLFISC